MVVRRSWFVFSVESIAFCNPSGGGLCPKHSIYDNTPEASAQGDVFKTIMDPMLDSNHLCFVFFLLHDYCFRDQIPRGPRLHACTVSSFLSRLSRHQYSRVRSSPIPFLGGHYISNWSCFSCERCHTPTGGTLMRVTVGAMYSSEGHACLQLFLSLFGNTLSTHTNVACPRLGIPK